MNPITLSELVRRYGEGERDFPLALITGSAHDVDLSSINLVDAKLRVHLDRVKLKGAILSRAFISGMVGQVDFTGADLSEANITAFVDRCQFDCAEFRGVRLSGAHISRSRLARASLREADLRDADFFEVDFEGIDLSGANCMDVRFSDCNLTNADLRSANFYEADLNRSVLRNARLQNARCQKANFRGADLTQAIGDEADFWRANFTLARLSRASMKKARFGAATMAEADLRRANLEQASLINASLGKAVATDCNFTGADLSGANLQFAAALGANFSNSKLDAANLERALLAGARFNGASVEGTFFWAAEIDDEALDSGQRDTVVTDPKPLPDFGGKIMYKDDWELRVSHTVMRVFFATDRGRVDSNDVGKIYGGERGEHLELGVCEVSVPRDHRMGRLEAPSIWRLEIRWNEQNHIVLKHIEPQRASRFWRELDDQLCDRDERQALLFVHGYNVSFRDGARRCAQIAYDLGFDGAPILYSWPSMGTVPGYFADEAAAEWTIPHLSSFLDELLRKPGLSKLHILSHSMGNRAVIRALEKLASERGEGKPGLAYVALTAPDIDAGVFKQVAPSIVGAAQTITLYASDNDRALQASMKFHAYRRAGQAGDNILVIRDIDTIDATQLDTDFLGHSYYAEERSVIADLFHLFRGRPPKERHGLRPVKAADLVHWKFQP